MAEEQRNPVAPESRRAMAEAEVRQEMQAEIEQRIEQKLSEQPTSTNMVNEDDAQLADDGANMN